jgi:hypothetical protein
MRADDVSGPARLAASVGAWLTEAARDWRTRRHRGERDLSKAVEAARQRGASWEEIGTVLNLSAEEAADRHSEPAGRPSLSSR